MKRFIIITVLFVGVVVAIRAQIVVEMTFPELSKDYYTGSLKPTKGFHFLFSFHMSKDALNVYLYEENNLDKSQKLLKKLYFKLLLSDKNRN